MRPILFALILPCAAAAAAAEPHAVVELLEDDAAGLLKLLTNPTGDPGTGHVEEKDVFSGKAAIRIVPMQRFSPKIEGWAYRIAEKPGPGEFRFLRYAWKADEATTGIMLQMHDERDWRVRLTAGQDMYNWGTKFVADKPPTNWTLVTRDLFQEYGQERTIQGIALTVFNGKGGWFDHIYLGRTIEDLDAIDAMGFKEAPKLDEKQLEQLWKDLGDVDEGKVYRARWTLMAVKEKAVAFLDRTLRMRGTPEAQKQIKALITELDAEDFAAREKAMKQLAARLDEAAGLLRAELDDATPEVRTRIERLLATPGNAEARTARVRRAVQMLEQINSVESKRVLEGLAKGLPFEESTTAAREALIRLEEHEKSLRGR